MCIKILTQSLRSRVTAYFDFVTVPFILIIVGGDDFLGMSLLIHGMKEKINAHLIIAFLLLTIVSILNLLP